ncbi:protein of unknown function [Pararobbsia alpina]
MVDQEFAGAEVGHRLRAVSGEWGVARLSLSIRQTGQADVRQGILNQQADRSARTACAVAARLSLACATRVRKQRETHLRCTTFVPKKRPPRLSVAAWIRLRS